MNATPASHMLNRLTKSQIGQTMTAAKRAEMNHSVDHKRLPNQENLTISLEEAHDASNFGDRVRS